MTHRHEARSWDGFQEHCRCGVSAGDVRNADGFRCMTFDEWPIKSERMKGMMEDGKDAVQGDSQQVS